MMYTQLYILINMVVVSLVSFTSLYILLKPCFKNANDLLYFGSILLVEAIVIFSNSMCLLYYLFSFMNCFPYDTW